VLVRAPDELDLVGVRIETLGSQEADTHALAKSPAWISKRKRVLASPALASAVAASDLGFDHAYDILTYARGSQAVQAHLARVKPGIESQNDTRAGAPSRRSKLPLPQGLPEEVPARNSAISGAPLPDMVTLSQLEVIQLERTQGGHVRREEVLAALRADPGRLGSAVL
jgi:hypothetical protein